MNLIEKYLKTNKSTYLYSKRIKTKKQVVTSVFRLIGAILSYTDGKRKTYSEYEEVRNNGYIFKPKNKSVHSCFYLPLLNLDAELESDAIQYSIFMLDDYYEESSLTDIKARAYLNENSVVLDIGSNIGNHTLFFCNECHVKKVYAFEPITTTYEILKKNIEINGLNDRVVACNFGVGASVSNANLSAYDLHNIGGATLELSNEGKIPIRSIDSLDIKEEIGFVKIDTEGFEVEVIKGMLNTLTRYTPPKKKFSKLPVFWIETGGDNLKTITDMLEPLGYNNIYYVGYGNWIFEAR